VELRLEEIGKQLSVRSLRPGTTEKQKKHRMDAMEKSNEKSKNFQEAEGGLT